MFTPSGKIEGSELRGGCGAYKGLLPPEKLCLPAALLRTFNQSNLGSMFFRNFAVFSKTASVWAAAIPQSTGICSPISIPKT